MGGFEEKGVGVKLGKNNNHGGTSAFLNFAFLESVTYANGVMHSYQYNNLNRLTALSISNSGSEILNAFNYQLNAVGHRTKVEEASGL